MSVDNKKSGKMLFPAFLPDAGACAGDHSMTRRLACGASFFGQREFEARRR